VGIAIDRDRFEEDEYGRFAERLAVGLRALQELLDRPGFGVGPATLGAELELSLIDADARPLPRNDRVLAETADPRMTFELDRFNLECNLRHGPLAGRPLAALRAELESALAEVRRAAAIHGGRVVMIGILPTLRPRDLQAAAMTDEPRYRALAAGLQRLRREPFKLDIEGQDHLRLTCDEVTFEGANTSLQVHLRADPSDFARMYNAVQMATAPALAAAGNSPTFLGHRLWHETRVALFKQAVDSRRGPGHESRVSFGTDWVQRSAFEIFRDNAERHVPLLPVVGDEDALACVHGGGVPGLDELRLHQGTIWSWNRVIYDPADGGHLRVEARALPAGPTLADMLANIAFLIGLALGLAEDGDAWTRDFPFDVAHDNFYRGAQSGLDATLHWPRSPGAPAEAVPARELVLRLLPLARRGLAHAGVETSDSDGALRILEERVVKGQTGAVWQRFVIDRLEDHCRRERALARMLEHYVSFSDAGDPVHRWPVDV
jgi:gamma-glutamyl:cysteine ligase YbdK (ATP-grasp superfamily)